MIVLAKKGGGGEDALDLESELSSLTSSVLTHSIV